MATRFATATGNWSNTGIWDNGAVPVAGDTVYPNGFSVTIDTDINVASLNNNVSNVYLPNMNIPIMTGNTLPSGSCFANSNTTQAYFAFDQNNTTSWQSVAPNIGIIGYQYTSAVSIKQYSWLSASNFNPNTWTFQGSNDGVNYTTIHTVTGQAAIASGRYASGIITNPNSYTYYRINVTACNSGYYVVMYSIDMTESTATSYGSTTGGSFTVPASLSGTRNIVQSGAGIVSNNTTIISIAATTGATVNFNISSGGFIFNQTGQRSALMTTPLINITGNCAVNFNTNLWGWQTNNITYNSQGNIYINAGATITVNGNIYGSKGGSSASTAYDSVFVIPNANAILNINGDVYGGSNTAWSPSIVFSGNGTANIVGNLYGDLSPSIYSTTACNVILIGTATVINSNSQAAIVMTSSSSLLTINGSITNKNNVNAILVPKIRFTSTAIPYWVYQTNGASDMTLAYGAATGSYPAEADVRFGTTYAASPTRTGTLRVPLPQYVSQGVLTDNTTGTAYLSATDVWNVLTSSITTAGSIGERLKVAATVETTGDQLAAYIV